MLVLSVGRLKQKGSILWKAHPAHRRVCGEAFQPCTSDICSWMTVVKTTLNYSSTRTCTHYMPVAILQLWHKCLEVKFPDVREGVQMCSS